MGHGMVKIDVQLMEMVVWGAPYERAWVGREVRVGTDTCLSSLAGVAAQVVSPLPGPIPQRILLYIHESI